MSLKEAAQYLQSQGRGNDSRLMHVSPRELQSLQTLAKAKGGSLTLNPNTGLPEAGLLEDILPVAAAGALMYFAPGVGPSIGAGLGLGTGALGTGVGMGLLAGGVQAATQLLSTGKVDLNSALRTGAISGATAGALQGFDMMPSTNVKTDVPALNLASQTANAPIVQGDFTSPAASYTPPDISANSYAYDAQGAMVPSNVPASITGSTNPLSGTTPPPGTTPPLGTDKSWWKSLTPGQQLMTGLGGVAGASLLAGANQPKIQTPASTSYIRPYTYSQTRNPNYGQPGQTYYNQGYTALPTYQAAEGGLMAAGGAVEEMSRQNTGENMYPMSKVDSATYSTPLQIPVNTSVITADYEPKTNPFTGALTNMAAGGTADSGYIPTSQAVQDYNKMLSDRAAEEYLRNPMPSAMMPASQRSNIAAPPAAQAPAISQDINGLYQYYLGRQPSADEAGQYSGQISGQVTPEMAAYFQQFTGGELAKTGYKPKGPNPFLGEPGLPMGNPMTGPIDGSFPGAPQYTYNSATKSYMPLSQQYTPFTQPAPARFMDASSGGKAGGLMPYDLGGYSDGGRLLKGPGDGMSDNIPASIGDKQPARLADGEFVVPADVVSHLGNGSTDAGAKKLYAMMDKVRTARVGTKKQGKEIKAEKYLKA